MDGNATPKEILDAKLDGTGSAKTPLAWMLGGGVNRRVIDRILFHGLRIARLSKVSNQKFVVSQFFLGLAKFLFMSISCPFLKNLELYRELIDLVLIMKNNRTYQSLQNFFLDLAILKGRILKNPVQNSPRQIAS